MAKRNEQVLTKKLKNYLEDKGYNKAEIARLANLKPDDFYAMLDNFRLMSVDEFARICKILGVTMEKILDCAEKEPA